MPELIFPLAEVLILAEHATAAPAYADPIGEEPAGPALLLVSADGIYLLSNGFPQFDAVPGETEALGLRAVYADRYGPGTPPTVREAAIGVHGETLTGVPVPPAILDRLRTAADDAYDLFTITLSATHATLGVARRRPGGAPA